MPAPSSTGNKKKRPGLRVMIPGSGKEEYPPGTLPRDPAAAQAAQQLVSGGLPMISPLGLTGTIPANPTPSILQAAGLANGGFTGLISPLWAQSPGAGGAGLSWPMASPSVVHTNVAGDIHVVSVYN